MQKRTDTESRSNPLSKLVATKRSTADPASSSGGYPLVRMRRNRKAEWARRLVAEHTLTVDDLVWPIFLMDTREARTPIAHMPGVDRLNIDAAVRAAERAAKLGIPAVAPFPYVDKSLRDLAGKEAIKVANLTGRAVRAIKQAVPEIGVICDVALDPYTTHSHDGLMGADGRILNDETVAVLVRQALALAEAGADCVAPSDMMDGRIGAIRRGLDADGHQDVQILSYAAKYASGFYGPFRDALGTAGNVPTDKRTYQMNAANTDEALREVALDLDEGADMVMVKPGMPYLDIVRRVSETFKVPTFAYQVSGEYSMLMAAAANGWLDGDRVMLESLMAFKRAGAAGVFTYFAPRAAELLSKQK